MVMTFSVIMYCVFRGQPRCPGGLRAVTHAQSFCAFDMEKGNKSQMPTDIHKHMAHRTDLALCVCVFPAVIHTQRIQVRLECFSSGDCACKSWPICLPFSEIHLKNLFFFFFKNMVVLFFYDVFSQRFGVDKKMYQLKQILTTMF